MYEILCGVYEMVQQSAGLVFSVSAFMLTMILPPSAPLTFRSSPLKRDSAMLQVNVERLRVNRNLRLLVEG